MSEIRSMKTRHKNVLGSESFAIQYFVVCTLAVMVFVFGFPARSAGSDTTPAPRLVLQITVDQLRGDMPGRYIERMGDGGFRWFLKNGTVYADAQHAHANTETIVGHATLATGSHPSSHGMVGNVWFDRESNELTYNIEDANHKLLSRGASVDRKTEIDPTQRIARSEGRSPASILVSTFGDELAVHTTGKSKVFSVSVKDRGAVSMAGHAGKAFWFSKSAGEFVTSDFYYESYPAWVEEWNAAKHHLRYHNQTWRLMHEQSSYLFADRDDQPWETAMPGFNRTFPHAYGPGDGKRFTTYLTLSPAGDDLTLDFAETLIEHEDIGQDDVTDYLSISFSSTDYVGHVFGPSSLEAEDNLLRLDRSLARLIDIVKDRIGLEHTLIILSADHGGPEAPGDLKQYGFKVNYVDPDSWEKESGFEALKRRFGFGKDLIRQYSHPYLYLNRELIEEHGHDLGEVERMVAEQLVRFEGVAQAVSSTALSRGEVPDTELLRLILNNHHPKRSGDVFVVFEPHLVHQRL